MIFDCESVTSVRSDLIMSVKLFPRSETIVVWRGGCGPRSPSVARGLKKKCFKNQDAAYGLLLEMHLNGIRIKLHIE